MSIAVAAASDALAAAKRAMEATPSCPVARAAYNAAYDALKAAKRAAAGPQTRAQAAAAAARRSASMRAYDADRS